MTAHASDLVDVKTGDRFRQPVPFGPVEPVRCADDTAHFSQVARSWECLTNCGRDLRPAS